ncbi:MAG: NifB/NifX family molybdenum-iron cluster-binding protein [Oscillospiraceae bacterium]
MNIAVTYENGNVFGHFGHTENFKIYNVEGDKVVSSKIVSAVGSGHGALAGFLAANGVDALICGGIGGGARTALAQAKIQLYPGVEGNADASVEAFLARNLQYNPNTTCNHHGEGEHGCGEHKCGEDKHGCGGNH